MKTAAPGDLGRKLGFRAGMRVGLVQVPPALEDLLRRSAPTKIRWSRGPGRARIDMVFYTPRRRGELPAAWRRLQSRINPDGAIWVIVPRKPVAEKRGLDFGWEDVQAAALETDLVDNKIASLTDEEYATRFVLRRSAR
ncbi:MAG TPA: hypothetical protein VGA32_05860 [Anaerolineales bacterium]